MSQEKKRYVVTYADEQSGKEALSETLKISTADIEDGLTVMASDRDITDADVLHFDNLNTSVVSLTDKQRADLQKNPGVVEVVEDFEMHALDAFTSNGDSTAMFDFDTYSATQTDTSNDQLIYMRGYSDGYQAMNAKLRELVDPGSKGTGQETDTQQATAPMAPPIPPFPLPTQPIPWNIQAVKAPGAWRRGIRGDGVKVAILDTGIGPHADLIVSGGASFVSGVASFNDDNGHGTHCAGITGARNNFIGVVGVAPRCNLFGVESAKFYRQRPIQRYRSGFRLGLSQQNGTSYP